MYGRCTESGVSRAEDGVLLALRGIMDGDRAAILMSGIGSGCGLRIGRAVGRGGCIIDKRLRRLASVGLTVRAPSPLILPDRLLLPDDVGVVLACKCAFELADLDSCPLLA